MKCPECDSEQQDNATLCSGCGLSFEMWRQHNPEGVKPKTDPPKEMAFPVPEEEEPGPLGEPAEDEPSQPQDEPTAEAPLEASGLAGASSPEPRLEGVPADSKGFQWKAIHSAGLGLAIVLVLGALYLIHRSTKPVPNPAPEKPPLLIPTPDTSATPVNGTSAVLTPAAEGTPSGTSSDAQAVPSTGNEGGSSLDSSTPIAATSAPELAQTSTPLAATPQDASTAPTSASTPDTTTDSTILTPSASPAPKSAIPVTPGDSSAMPATAATQDASTDSAALKSSTSPTNIRTIPTSSLPKSAIPEAAVTSPVPISSPDLLESSQAVPTPTAIPVP